MPMPSVTGAFVIVCLLWGFLGLVVLWVFIQHQRDRAHMNEAQRMAAERNRARQDNPPADQQQDHKK